ncbi:MAG: hypothetical protein CM15mP9_2960 [Methanobacteriota archaeon]|nr:MAG: hypothetical protein CM15mP9_2960 [Euryarchaeota archaeon]
MGDDSRRWIYIHDMTVQKWPGEDTEDPRYGRTFIYGSYWEAGLRIGDVTDVPHPVNSPELYSLMASTCKAGQGNPLMCRWRAPEGWFMDGLPRLGWRWPTDSGTTGNEMVEECLTFTMQNQFQRCLMYLTLDLATNLDITSQQR